MAKLESACENCSQLYNNECHYEGDVSVLKCGEENEIPMDVLELIGDERDPIKIMEIKDDLYSKFELTKGSALSCYLATYHSLFL